MQVEFKSYRAKKENKQKAVSFLRISNTAWREYEIYISENQNFPFFKTHTSLLGNSLLRYWNMVADTFVMHFIRIVSCLLFFTLAAVQWSQIVLP